MDMEAALRARLTGAAAVNAIVGERVYWDGRPQGSLLPDITLSVVRDDRPQHMQGFQAFRPTDIQIDVRASSFAQKKALKEAVISAVTPKNVANGVRFDRATDIRARPLNENTDTQFIYRDVIELTIWHSPA